MLGKTSKLSLSKLTPLQDNDVRHKSNFMSTCGFQLPVSVLTPVCFHNQFCPTNKKKNSRIIIICFQLNAVVNCIQKEYGMTSKSSCFIL